MMPSCSDDPAPSACDPNSPNYTPELASVIVEGFDIIALAYNDSPVWRRKLPGLVTAAELHDIDPADRCCPPAKRVVCGTKVYENTDYPGGIVTFTEVGDKVWTYVVSDTSPYQDGSTCKYNILDVEVACLHSNDIPVDAKIVAIAADMTWFPNVIVVLDLTGHILGKYWHPGHLEKLVVEDIDHLDPSEVIFCGISNDLAGYWLRNVEGIEPGVGHYFAAAGVLSGDDIFGQAIPYYGTGVSEAEEIWYAFAYDTTALTMTALNLQDHNSDGLLDVEAWCDHGYCYYVDCNGDSLIGLGRADNHTPCIPRFVLIRGDDCTIYWDPRCPWGALPSDSSSALRIDSHQVRIQAFRNESDVGQY